jgi:hypothetical protein
VARCDPDTEDVREYIIAPMTVPISRHLTDAPAPSSAACDMIATAADPARHVLWPTNPYVLVAPPGSAFESFDRMTALPRG